MILHGQEIVDHINSQLKKFGKSDPGKTVCVDFDSVLAKWESGDSIEEIGEALGPGIQLTQRIKKLGLKPVVLTARPKRLHSKLEDFLKSKGAAAPVTNVKPPALMYVDDKGEKWPENFDRQMESFNRDFQGFLKVPKSKGEYESTQNSALLSPPKAGRYYRKLEFRR